jgi:hypothetical protein
MNDITCARQACLCRARHRDTMSSLTCKSEMIREYWLTYSTLSSKQAGHGVHGYSPSYSGDRVRRIMYQG